MEVRAKIKEELPNELGHLRQRVAQLEQANRVLRESEDVLDSPLLSGPDPMVVYDTEGRVLFLNSAFTKIFGWSNEELLGRRIDYVPEDCWPQTKETLERSFRGEPVPSFDTKRLTKDGRNLDIHISSALLRDSEGKPAGHIVTLRDVTERKRSEQALRESEKRYRSLFENMVEGFAYCQMLFQNGKPQDFIYLDVNEAFERLTGLMNVTGKKVTEVLPGIKESNPELFEIYGEVASTGNPAKFETYLDPLGLWLSISVYSPKKGHFVAVFDNVTDRKRSEEELHKNEERLELALKGADLGLWDMHMRSGVAVVNPRAAEIIGYSLDEIEPTFSFWENLLHPDDRKTSMEKVSDHLAGVTDYFEDEYRLRTRSGEWKWIFARGKVTERDRDGKPLRMTGTFLDISKRKRAEEALRQSEERYRTVADFTYDWEYWVDPEGKVLYVSPSCERITGYSAQEFLDDPSLMERIVHPEDLDEVMNHFHIARKVDHENPYSIDFRIIQRDGQTRWINHACRPVHRKGEQPLGRRASNRDITDRKRVEESLRSLLDFRQTLIDSIPNPVFYKDVDGKYIGCNEAFAALVGVPKEAVVGRTVFEVAPKDLADIWREKDQELFDGPHVQVFECTMARPDGTERSLVFYKAPLFDSHGALAGLIGVVMDITDRLRAEEAVRQSEEWYRALVENSFDGIFIQRGPKIIFANSRLYDMLGYSQGELEGLDHWVIYHPEYQEITRVRAVARMRGEDVVSQYEVKLQRRDGSTFDGEISARAVKVKGEPGVQVWVRDDSKRKRSEEAQRRLATAVEQAAEAIVITDTAGNIQYVNPAFEQISGYTQDEAIGQNPKLLKSGEHDREFYENLWDTITRGQVWTGRFINKRKDGSLYHEESTISPVLNSNGKILNFVAVKRDITEQLALSRQLLQAQKMEAIGTLAGGMAHDFNNLLQVMLGYSELMLAEKRKDDPAYADLSKIFQASKSGAELVRRLLTFSRKVEPKTIPLNLNRRILRVEQFLQRTIPKMIDIQLDLSDDLADINADPTQMEQVLMNLAVNARDAMPDRGKLTIGTKNVTIEEGYLRIHGEAKPGEYVLLMVSDTGHGMDKATIDHIFEPFFTTKGIGKGTGLGLAMVYGIVNQHGGHITCDSEVGGGTTFNAYLPAIEPQIESDVATSGEFPAFGTETVLLVDDEDFVRDLGERILSKDGYTVLTAADGREACVLFGQKREQISLVILDLIMPEMGGQECLRELLKIDPEMKVLMASGYSADASAQGIIESGAKGFVDKPFRMKELLRQVRKVLDES